MFTPFCCSFRFRPPKLTLYLAPVVVLRSLQRRLAQVQTPLLPTLALSPDFRPAYDPLLGMAGALARSDAAAARTLLTALVQLQPARPEAGLALRALAEAPH